MSTSIPLDEKDQEDLHVNCVNYNLKKLSPAQRRHVFNISPHIKSIQFRGENIRIVKHLRKHVEYDTSFPSIFFTVMDSKRTIYTLLYKPVSFNSAWRMLSVSY
jgi:hypothetical protein